MKLEPLLTYRATLGQPADVGAGPRGPRVVVDVTGGDFDGPRLKGRILPSGADWLLLDAEGTAYIDVRITFATDDGAHIYVQYHGRMVDGGAAVARALAGEGGTEFGDLEFFTQLRFETGDPRYTWLNRVVAVGQGRLLNKGVEYEIFQCVND